MSQVNWVCLAIVILGFMLFLYGANMYDAFAGWIGVFLFLGGILIFLVFYIYGGLIKKEKIQNP